MKFDIDGDGKVDMKEQVQSELALILKQNRVELAKQVLLIPLGLIGTVIHAPIIVLSKFLGLKMGVSTTTDGGAPSSDDNFDGKDQSVVATMQMMGGLVGVAILYPAIGIATTLFTSLSPLLTVSCVAASGYAMALSQPVGVFIRKMKAAKKIHSSKQSTEWMSELKQRRESLQSGLRSFADDNAPSDMKGWWKNPEKYVSGLKKQQLEAEKQW